MKPINKKMILGLSLMLPFMVQSEVCNSIKNNNKNCVSIVEPGSDNATDFFNGDFYFHDKSGVMSRIGAVPVQYVQTEDGVMMLHHSGRKANLNYWANGTPAGQYQICRKGISLRDIKKKKIDLSFIEGVGVRVQKKNIAKTYKDNCNDSGKERIFFDLTEDDVKVLNKYSPFGSHMSNELTNADTNATFPDILGRDEIVDKIIAKIRNKTIRSSLLWGPAGVGKTQIVYRLATRIIEGNVPEWLKDWKVFTIDPGGFNSEGKADVADQKMLEIVKAASGKKVILLMDEIHRLISIGKGQGDTTDVTEGMKNALADGELAVIGTLTDAAEEMNLFRTKKALYTRFGRIFVEDPKPFVLKKIYRNLMKKNAKKFGVIFEAGFENKIIRLSAQYMPTEHAPRVGVNLIESIASEFSPVIPGATAPVITEANLKKMIGEASNITTLLSSKDDQGQVVSFEEKVWNFDKNVRKKYIGQDAAISSIKRELINVAANTKASERPPGIFLFIGPSGVGKSYLATLTGKMFDMKPELFGMNAYKSEADINTLLGSPDGYIGSKAGGGQLIQWVNNNPTSTIIFDEIEKAHPSILDALMTFMETGVISGKSGGSKATFKNGFLFFTSNVAMDLVDAYDVQVKGIPDPSGKFGKNYKLKDLPKTEDELKEMILSKIVADGSMPSYFVGRFNKSNIIIFHHLNKNEAYQIAQMEVNKVAKQFTAANKVTITDDVVRYVAKKGYDFKFGARGMRNVSESLLMSAINQTIFMKRLKKTMPAKYSIEVKMSKVAGKVEVTIKEEK